MSKSSPLSSPRSRANSLSSSSSEERPEKKVVDDSYKAFILPQYQGLCDESFLQNNMHPSCSAQATKEKLNEIGKMIQQSQAQFGVGQSNNQGKESKQLKNDHTISWLKKRFLDCGNKKYFGDEEDVAQQRFISAIYANITQYLKTPEGIQLNDFNRLLQHFDLPLSYQTLSRIYALVDQDRDSHLNLLEFTRMLLSDQANRIYLSMVKDKSIGLLKMLELIKEHGHCRIKNEFDKRIIRKLKIEHNDQLGFASPFHSFKATNSNQGEFLEENILDSLEFNQKTSQNNSITIQKDTTAVSSDEQSPLLPDITKAKGKYNRFDFQKVGKTKSGLEKQMDQIVKQASKEGSHMARHSFHSQQLSLQELQTQAQLERTISKVSSQKQLKSLQLPSITPSHAASASQSQILGNLNPTDLNKFHSLNNNNIISKGEDNTASSIQNNQNKTNINSIGNASSIFMNQKQNSSLNGGHNMSSFQMQSQINMKSISQADFQKTKGYSKQMGFLMDKTLREAENSRQTQVAKRIMHIEDSKAILAYRNKMKNIQEKTQLRTNNVSAFLSGSKKDILPADILNNNDFS